MLRVWSNKYIEMWVYIELLWALLIYDLLWLSLWNIFYFFIFFIFLDHIILWVNCYLRHLKLFLQSILAHLFFSLWLRQGYLKSLRFSSWWIMNLLTLYEFELRGSSLLLLLLNRFIVLFIFLVDHFFKLNKTLRVDEVFILWLSKSLALIYLIQKLIIIPLFLFSEKLVHLNELI
jgi:hypothetical protein